MNTTDSIHQLLIPSVTPYFLEKEAFWFQENLEEVLQAQKTQSFFQDNLIFLKRGQSYTVYELLRKLDEMGYEKVFSVKDPGEFSQRGGTIDIFPIQMTQAVRLDFLGNILESIRFLNSNNEEEKVYPPKFDEEKFRRTREILKKKLKSQKLFSDIKSLKPGDYLVHLDHGVGKFVDIKNISEAKYYVLEYAKGDTLYVPLELGRKLSRYVGFANPTIARLGSELWQRTKRKVKEDVERLAKELLALYAKKEMAEKKPYFTDEASEEQLLQGFFHEETPDQLQAIADIKEDLSKEKPMDRIVCGDVGFGKTEVAMRSALIAATNNYQVAIICPTTILASQHFNTFKERFKNLPVNIALLSRLETKRSQQKIIHGIQEGSIDIVIGTHRILSKDIVFKNLQLLIIDDEQRFGVKQKEKLRNNAPALDILSLSATPIPRTLYLALASFKNVSLMQTPPKGRLAIETRIMPYHAQVIKEAVEFEIQRGGQVYFLHNRIESIDHMQNMLQKLIPSATIAYLHGRMPESQIMNVMDDFKNKKIHILIATTIIENGIDLPNVNTIIVQDASRLGLAQAYQIRGRVGRSVIKSFAYLFYPKHLSDLAKDRLKALGEIKELGAGYHIALKDLEIRGAGNILGREQSGSINKIGLNLYCQMLAEAVEKSRIARPAP